jgi:hypothetical protein
MKTSKGLALVAFAAASYTGIAHADGFYWTLAYEPGVPLGSMRNASPYVTPAGASLGARYLFTDHWSLGIGGHWTQFSHTYPVATYPIDNGAATGAVYRRVWVGTLLAEAQVYLKPDRPVNPFFGVGAGIGWMSNQALVSDFSRDDLARGFAVAPEAGILIAFDRDPYDPPGATAMQSAMIGVRYSYNAAGARDVSNTQVFSLELGLFVY